MSKTVTIPLRKEYAAQAWGFRLIGGINPGQPLIVQKVAPQSFAHHAGLREGDQLIQVGDVNIQGLTHVEVQEVILRCGNTLDFVIKRRSDADKVTNRNMEQKSKQIVHAQYNSPLGLYSSENVAETLKHYRVRSEGEYYSQSSEYKDGITSPVKQKKSHIIASQEEEMRYQYNHPQSPIRGPSSPKITGNKREPISPFQSNNQYDSSKWYQNSPSDERIFSPPYKPPMSPPLQDPSQKRDNKIFAVKSQISSGECVTPKTLYDYKEPLSPRPQSPGPRPFSPQQVDNMLFGPNQFQGQRPLSPQPIDNRVFGQSPAQRPLSPQPIDNRVFGQIQTQRPFSPQPMDNRGFGPNQSEGQWPLNQQPKRTFGNQSQQPLSPKPKDKFFGQNYPQTNELNQNHKQMFGMSSRPPAVHPKPISKGSGQSGPDYRIFGIRNKPQYQESDEMIPLIKTKNPDHILPSQAKHEQSYLTHMPPTTMLLPPTPTGASSMRRRINPEWPPQEPGKFVSKVGFSPFKRQNPSKRFIWPPPNEEDFYYNEDVPQEHAPGSGPLTKAWNPRSGSVTPPNLRSYVPSGKVKNTQWPPPNYRPQFVKQSSLPPDFEQSDHYDQGLRSSRVEDYYQFHAQNRIPQTYRPPPGTQYCAHPGTFCYDTD